MGGDPNRYHQAAAVLAGPPYIFQFSCPRSGSPTLLNASYEKMIAPVISGTAPTFTTVANVSSSIISALGNVFDVAAATLNSRMYLFVLRGNGSNPDSISVLSYGGQGSGSPELESSYTFAGTNLGIQIQSVEATNVTLASGEQAIVVSSPFVGSGQAQVKAWLFTGNSGGQAVTITPYSLANPSYANYPAAIRMAYGPAQGTEKVNSLTLFYAALDGGFFGVSGRIYTSQLVLPPSLESGSLSQAGSWTRLTGIWQNSDGFLRQYPYDWTAFSVSLPSSTSTNGYSNVDQYITLMEKGSTNSLAEHRNSFVTSLALQLRIDQGTAGQEWISSEVSNLSPADQVAAVESWNLLGIITGLPPLPAGTTVTYRAPILELKYSTSESASKQVSDTSVVTAGASADVSDLTASADYTYSSEQGTTSSSTISLALNAEFHSAASTNTYDKYADTGFLIVSQPNLVTGNYHVYAYDGTTPLGISTVTISVGSTSFAAIPFRLTNPRYEVPGEPACIYDSFPTVTNDASEVVYPMTTDIVAWENPATLNDVQPLFPSLNPQIINGTYTNSVQLSLTSSNQNTFSGETSNTIDVGEGVSFLGIGAEGDTSIKLTS